MTVTVYTSYMEYMDGYGYSTFTPYALRS